MSESTVVQSDVRTVSRLAPIGGVLLLLAAISGYVFLISPLRAELSLLQEERGAAVVVVNERRAQVENFEKAEKDLGISSEVEKFEARRAIPEGLMQDEAIRDLITIVESHDIGLTALSFGKGGGNDALKTLRINAGFEGNYADLLHFLEGIEQNPRIFQVESINVQMSTLDLTGFQRAHFSLVINAYYQ